MKVAVIPARGGSKRIPRKNIREFYGKPMIAHSIGCALRAGIFDRVIVSTDDSEIAEVAGRFGAEVPFMRPGTLADDYTGTIDVIAHAITWLSDNGAAPASVCCIYATAPFMREEDLREGLRVLDGGSWHYVFAATVFAAPVQRSFVRKENGGVQMLFPECFNSRSQDLPEAFHDAGQFYWGRPESWLAGEPVFTEQSTIVALPRWRVHDIDTPDDWVRAELMYGAQIAQL